MNTSEFIDEIADRLDETKMGAKRYLDAHIEIVTETLLKGDTLTLPGFVTISVTKRAARKGRNPRTGEAMQIPATKTPKFKAGKKLKDAIKRKK